MADEENDYDGATAEYSPKSEFSKPKIVYEAMQKCMNSRGDEMKAGYYNTKLTPEGIPIRTWIKDSRQVYIGTVIALRGLLSPEIKLNPKYKERMDSSKEKLLEFHNKYVYSERIRSSKDGRMIWVKTGRKYIPEIDDFVLIQDANRPQQAMESKGAWNSFVNSYWNECVTVYDEIFECLNDLINNLNYFKQAISY